MHKDRHELELTGRTYDFQYTNVPDEYIKKVGSNNTGDVVLGKGPFREVQIWIGKSQEKECHNDCEALSC